MLDDFKIDVAFICIFQSTTIRCSEASIPQETYGAIPSITMGAVLYGMARGSFPQSAPIRSPNEIFVEYNWTSAIKIKLFYFTCKLSPKLVMAQLHHRDRRPCRYISRHFMSE